MREDTRAPRCAARREIHRRIESSCRSSADDEFHSLASSHTVGALEARGGWRSRARAAGMGWFGFGGGPLREPAAPALGAGNKAKIAEVKGWLRGLGVAEEGETVMVTELACVDAACVPPVEVWMLVMRDAASGGNAKRRAHCRLNELTREMVVAAWADEPQPTGRPA